MKNKVGYLLLLCLLVACKSAKQPTAENVTFKTLSAPSRLTLQSESRKKELSVDAQLKIIKNEAIQLSLRIPFLGSEAMRVVITQQNVLIIDRLNKQYVSEALAAVQNQLPLPLDYSDMENLLTGKNTSSSIPCEYADWQNGFPRRLQISQATEKDRYGMTLTLKSVDFDADLSIDTSIPSNYKQITLQQAMKLIRNLL